MMATNMEAAAHLTALFLPAMLAAGRGHVINVGSIAGIFPNQGVALYSATKSFLNGFTTALHRELRGSGVSASVMNLGPVQTEFFEQALKIEGGRRVPAEKLAVPVERVNTALWRLLRKPRRAVYVPRWLYFANYADLLFGGLVDLIGPGRCAGVNVRRCFSCRMNWGDHLHRDSEQFKRHFPLKQIGQPVLDLSRFNFRELIGGSQGGDDLSGAAVLDDGQVYQFDNCVLLCGLDDRAAYAVKIARVPHGVPGEKRQQERHSDHDHKGRGDPSGNVLASCCRAAD